MRFKLSLYLAICCFTFSGFLTAQAGNPATADTASLQTQFDGMLEVSNRYQDFKVVRRTFLEAFAANVKDSIGNYTEEIGELKRNITQLNTQLESRGAEMVERDESINALENERDSVSLLGIQLSKTVYNLIMWSLVIGLSIALLVVLASARVAVSGNSSLKRERDKLATELEQSRKSRLSVEQDLRRKLQDEINKNR